MEVEYDPSQFIRSTLRYLPIDVIHSILHSYYPPLGQQIIYTLSDLRRLPLSSIFPPTNLFPVPVFSSNETHPKTAVTIQWIRDVASRHYDNDNPIIKIFALGWSHGTINLISSNGFRIGFVNFGYSDQLLVVVNRVENIDNTHSRHIAIELKSRLRDLALQFNGLLFSNNI